MNTISKAFATALLAISPIAIGEIGITQDAISLTSIGAIEIIDGEIDTPSIQIIDQDIASINIEDAIAGYGPIGGYIIDIETTIIDSINPIESILA